jgi:two-component system, OmpR family, phosphate regulon response regulator PhoB
MLNRRRKATSAPAALRDSGDVLVIGDMSVDLAAGRLFRFGRELHLRPKEFHLLCFFMLSPGKTFTREQLWRTLWGQGIDIRIVDMTVSRLRRAINRGHSPDPIESVRFRGYRFVSDFEQRCEQWKAQGKDRRKLPLPVV